MASKFEKSEVLAHCQGCGSSTNPTSSYAVEEKSRKILCTECAEKNPDVMLDPEPDKWMCDQHGAQPASLFCVTCQTCACVKCVHSTHKRHEFEAIEKAIDDLQKAKHDKMAPEGNKNACNLNKFAAVKIEMRRKLDQKCQEAKDRARDHYRQRKERLDAEVDARIKRLNYIRDKRLAEDNAEEDEVATLIEKERLNMTAKIIETDLASKNCFRYAVKDFEKDTLVDTDAKRQRERRVTDTSKTNGHAHFSVGIFRSLLVKVMLWLFTGSSSNTCPTGPEDYSKKRTCTLLFKIVHITFSLVSLSLIFVVIDVFCLDFFFTYLYVDYQPLLPMKYYNYSSETFSVTLFFLFVMAIFVACCHNCDVLLEIILELSKRFEPELGVVGNVSSAVVAICGFMVSGKRRRDIEQVFIKSNVWGVPLGQIRVNETNHFLLRFCIGSIIFFVHIRCFYPQIDWIYSVYLFWHPIILCLVSITDRPWSLLMAYASFYLLFRSRLSIDFDVVFTRNPESLPLELDNNTRYFIYDESSRSFYTQQVFR